MTICIAAACESGRNIVVAADRMFTLGQPLNVEFEPPIGKIMPIWNSCLGLGAGNGLWVSEILTEAKNIMMQGNRVAPFATVVKQVYGKFRDERMEESVIRQSLGADFELFRQRGGTLPQYLQVQPGIYQQLFVQMNQFNLGVEILIAGIDEAGSHIHFIGHPGQAICFDKIGYNAIGSGATHAAIRFALGLQHPKLGLSETLFSVYAAKRASEVAPGVGRDTEMSIISAEGVWNLPAAMIEKLEKLSEEQRNQPRVEEIGVLYDELRKDAGNHNGAAGGETS